ncbi:hypothetical protein Mgra_00008909 [Meloidogyne graminicola]|uniref:Uncharacterized protein n=1 Tax=Meloidogyne graminicola TaxID=189291 RepID=A0A8S9ZEC1_9BILA|nr:hypothetical protein Mgra_00008909 [Meloidogyne graminicola]
MESTEIKNFSQHLSIEKNYKNIKDSDILENVSPQPKSRTKMDKYMRDICELITLLVNSPRILFISAFLCAPYSNFCDKTFVYFY